MIKKQLLHQIGVRLEKLRQSLNFSTDEMAIHLNMTRNGYNKNERGMHLPQLTTLLNLSKNFDVSMDWLLFDKGPVHYKEKGGVTEPAEQVETPAAQASAAAPQQAVIKAGKGVTGNLLPETMPEDFEPGAVVPAIEPVTADIQRLLAHIAIDPQLRYEVLAYYFRYIKEHPDSM
jgi:transcriptional regulator with XRE-family HTH domain